MATWEKWKRKFKSPHTYLDDVKLYFGDADDASIKWDGSELDITAATVNIVGSFTTAYPIVSTYGGTAISVTSSVSSADNGVEIALTSSATSGVTAAMFTQYTSTGDNTSHAIVHNMLLTIGGDTQYAYVQYIGSATISNKTIDQACGIYMYLEDMGNACQYQAAISINRNITNVGINGDCFVEMRNHTSTAATAYMRLTGPATFLWDFSGTTNVAPVSEATDSTNVSDKVAVKMASGITRYLHLFSD